jgi:putative flippase GtrA
MSAEGRAPALGQMARYAAVGLALNAAGYALYLGATWLGAGHKTTMSVLYAAFVAAGYWGHRRWAFRHRGDVPSSLARYLVAHALGYGLNLLLLAWFADHLGFPHQLVQAAAIVAVAGFLFVAFRFFAFAPGR